MIDAVGVAGIGDADRAVHVQLAGSGKHALESAIAGRGDHDDAAGNEAIAIVADRRPAAGEVLNIVDQRQTQVHAVNHRLIAVAFR